MNGRPTPWMLALVALAACGSASILWWQARPEARQAEARRDYEISARKFAFSPAAIEVDQGDLVRVTLRAEDIAHSFTIDEYRIAKRANPGHVVTFEFRADRPGTFTFYCNLTIDDGCRNMRGRLVVRTR